MGLGAGASFLPLLTMGMADAPPQDAGLASGIINVSVQLFGAIGLAMLGTVATDHTKRWRRRATRWRAALTGGYHLAYLVGSGLRGGRRLHPCCCSARRQPATEEADSEAEVARARLRPQRSSPDLAARRLRQLGGELDDPRVLVGRGLAP